MQYTAALALLHEILQPINYFEIGCRHGYSLALARENSIAVDPDFEIKAGLTAPTRLFKCTSDEFFARGDLAEILIESIDFAFIDGMHQVEFALRDFINIEKHARASSVVAIDDVLPQRMEYASRDRQTQIWSGDVYRLIPVLRNYRPDLDVQVYDVELKGLAVVSRLDPSSSVLSDNYTEIARDLQAGKWSLPSVEAIHGNLAPRSVTKLSDDARAIRDRRRNSGGDNLRSARELYLELLKRSILNEIYLDDELRILYLRDCLAGTRSFEQSVFHDPRVELRAEYDHLVESRKIGRFFNRSIQNCGFSHSMMGRKRMDNLHFAMDVVRNENIPGDLIECGVWRGGGCIFMAGYLRAHEMRGRRIFVADSFEGLPAPSLQQDKGLDLSKDRFPQLAVSAATVRDNFSLYDLGSDDVVFLNGWFKDTLKKAPIDKIALLRLDGDLYESTDDALSALYDRVVPGGIVIIDDYNAIAACRLAVKEFFTGRGLVFPTLNSIDWTGVWFRKAGDVRGEFVASSRTVG